MLWAYLAFTQFLIIWAEDLPAEIGWYVARSTPAWKWVAIGVLVLQFAVPAAAMLFRAFKSDPRRLGGLCGVVLAAHWAELLWLVQPPFRSHGAWLDWMDAIALLAVGGLWFAHFLFAYVEPPLTPVAGEPAMADHA